MLFVCYPGCSTCTKARKWLDSMGADYQERNIRTDNPTEEELTLWHAMSGLPLKKFFNTSGQRYKELQLKDRLPNMSEGEQLQLLASDGMLVKRPLMVLEERVLVGFQEEQWKQIMH